MLENLQQLEASTKNTDRTVGFSVNAVQLREIIALLLALSLIPTLSGVALIA
jgi:hypothetical protein